MIHDNVIIAESTIPFAGKGVFASRNIKKAEIICFYDGVNVIHKLENKIGYYKVISTTF